MNEGGLTDAIVPTGQTRRAFEKEMFDFYSKELDRINGEAKDRTDRLWSSSAEWMHGDPGRARWLLWDAVSDLDIAFSELSDLYRRARKKHSGLTVWLNESIIYIYDALSKLDEEHWTSSHWVTDGLGQMAQPRRHGEQLMSVTTNAAKLKTARQALSQAELCIERNFVDVGVEVEAGRRKEFWVRWPTILLRVKVAIRAIGHYDEGRFPDDSG